MVLISLLLMRRLPEMRVPPVLSAPLLRPLLAPPLLLVVAMA
jgi:hypothetical protein